jgi:uncharacterized protein YjiS (DUF1127 family)
MNIIASLFRRSEKRRTYADLLRLDDHLLRDIGVTRTDLFQLMHGRDARARDFRSHD